MAITGWAHTVVGATNHRNGAFCRLFETNFTSEIPEQRSITIPMPARNQPIACSLFDRPNGEAAHDVTLY